MEHLKIEINEAINNEEMTEKLFQYSKMIFESNKDFNLTGLKSIDDIVRELIIRTIKPVKERKVPRGTKYCDIGSGNGIPGIVLNIIWPGSVGVLVDSNSKRTAFLNEIKTNLSLENIYVETVRIEEYAKLKRESFDFCCSRAFGPLYSTIEFGLPMLKEGSYLYVYSSIENKEISEEMNRQIGILGGLVVEDKERKESGFNEEGVLIKKIMKTPEKYPRRFPVVKREAEKMKMNE